MPPTVEQIRAVMREVDSECQVDKAIPLPNHPRCPIVACMKADVKAERIMVRVTGEDSLNVKTLGGDPSGNKPFRDALINTMSVVFAVSQFKCAKKGDDVKYVFICEELKIGAEIRIKKLADNAGVFAMECFNECLVLDLEKKAEECDEDPQPGCPMEECS